VSQAANGSSDPIKQLRKEMGFWDVLFFNIATVLGPRWIAAAAHNGTPSISLWVLAAVFFFVPSAMVINELSSRFPEEGGLYVWAKEAFGDFHGFVAGWTYWVYTIFYFPGLLLASAAMSGYLAGSGGAALAQDRTFLLVGSFVLLFVAVILNIIGLNVGKWLQNAGGVSTYIPLMILVLIGATLWLQHGSVTQFTWANMMPHWSWDTVNFWSQIAFAFTGLELVSAMSAEIRDPRRTLPRAVLTSGAMIAVIYILGTLAVLSIQRAACFRRLPTVRRRCGSGSLASWLRCWFPWEMPAGWEARWRALRACRSLWASTATCRRHLEKFIHAGKHRMFRSSCRRWRPARCCSSAKSARPCEARIRFWWTSPS
jgi:amino acid transporter